MSKSNISLLLELDELVNRGSGNEERISELRQILNIEIVDKVEYPDKKEFPLEQYVRMKAFGLTDLNAAFLLNVSPPYISHYKVQNKKEIDEKVSQYREHRLVEKFKKTLLKGNN